MGRRLQWIDTARGVGMILCVAAHSAIGLFDAGLLDRRGPAGLLVGMVYTFHMPLFMFLAGLFVQQRLAAGRGRFLRATVTTLVVPYLVWGAVALVAMALGRGIRSDVGTMHLGLYLLWTPIAWLWFLWVLAIYQVVSVVLADRKYLLMAVAAILYLSDMVVPADMFGLKIAHFMIFYVAGVIVGPHLAVRGPRLPAVAIAGLGAGTLVAAYATISAGLSGWSSAALPAALAGIAFVCAAAGRRPLAASRLLVFIGERSLAVYVTHIFFMTAARIALYRSLGVTDPLVHLLVATAAGLAGSLLLQAIAQSLGLTVVLGLGRPVAHHAPRPAADAVVVDGGVEPVWDATARLGGDGRGRPNLSASQRR